MLCQKNKTKQTPSESPKLKCKTSQYTYKSPLPNSFLDTYSVSMSTLECKVLLFTQSFSHQRYLIVFHWSLNNSKSPQVSRTLLSILVVLNNVVVWMVFTRPPTSKSSGSFNNPLVIVPKSPIVPIGTIITFIFDNFFNCLARSWYLSFFSHSFSFILWSAGTTKSTILQIHFFFFG